MNLIRNNLKNLEPYTSARDIYKEGIFLDANESNKQWVDVDWSSIGELNRYPDSQSRDLREKLVMNYVKGFKIENVFIGSGSDEIIDLLIRGFVEDDEFVMTMDPSYSIYEVQANINSKGAKKVLIKKDFSLDIERIKGEVDKVKILFLCSPNNPTGNLVSKEEILKLLKFYKGLVVIDEAYIEYAGLDNSLESLVKDCPSIVVVRTFSKAWGLAGLRLGYCIADPEIIGILEKIKDSYNVSKVSQLIAVQALDQLDKLEDSIKETLLMKSKIEEELKSLGLKIILTKTNFILVQIPEVKSVYKKIADKGLITRDRSNLTYLENVLRVTVGNKEENELFIQYLKELL